MCKCFAEGCGLDYFLDHVEIIKCYPTATRRLTADVKIKILKLNEITDNYGISVYIGYV
jgi:hypothetical protein